MPHEILDKIAYNLPHVDDILSFAKTCSATRNAVYDLHATCWRRRFAKLYDLPPVKAVSAIRAKFVQRDLLRFRLIFKLGNGRAARGRFNKDEEKALNIMRDLVVGTYSILRLEPIAHRGHFKPITSLSLAIQMLMLPVLQSLIPLPTKKNRRRTTSESCAGWQTIRTSAM